MALFAEPLMPHRSADDVWELQHTAAAQKSLQTAPLILSWAKSTKMRSAQTNDRIEGICTHVGRTARPEN